MLTPMGRKPEILYIDLNFSPLSRLREKELKKQIF